MVVKTGVITVINYSSEPQLSLSNGPEASNTCIYSAASCQCGSADMILIGTIELGQ